MSSTRNSVLNQKAIYDESLSSENDSVERNFINCVTFLNVNMRFTKKKNHKIHVFRHVNFLSHDWQNIKSFRNINA